MWCIGCALWFLVMFWVLHISLLFRFVVFDLAGLTGLKPHLICFTSDKSHTKKCVKDSILWKKDSILWLLCFWMNAKYLFHFMSFFFYIVVSMFWKLYILGLLKMPLFILSTLTVKILLWKEWKPFFSFFCYGFFFFFTVVASVFFCFAGCPAVCFTEWVCECVHVCEIVWMRWGENHINKIDFLNYFKEELHELYDAVLFWFYVKCEIQRNVYGFKDK